MSNEELMEPRIKIIADYPGAFAIVGSVWTEDCGVHYIQHHEELNADKYPHLFRKLQWWEERTPEEMPKYIKVNGKYFERSTEDPGIYGVCYIKWPEVKGVQLCSFYQSTPATEEEYNNQITTK